MSELRVGDVVVVNHALGGNEAWTGVVAIVTRNLHENNPWFEPLFPVPHWPGGFHLGTTWGKHVTVLGHANV